MHIVIAPDRGQFALTPIGDDGVAADAVRVPRAQLAAEVARREASDSPRWVWESTELMYPDLLAAGVRVARCVDLRLCHTILRNAAAAAHSELALVPHGAWDEPAARPSSAPTHTTLFDFETERDDALDPVAEFALQRGATTSRLGFLLAAESAGALVAAEIYAEGLPWREEIHLALLERLLGPRPRDGERPQAMEQLCSRIRDALNAPTLNPDSQAELLRALRRAGIQTESTRSWELNELKHPVIAPLLEYKKLARLLSANGWHWLESNVSGGRFRPDYVPGGVVTGRWASRGGGGALQLPKQIRGAVVADPGCRLVVADAAQLEPRILAALSSDRGMIEAGAAGDLYAGIVASGAVATRDEAKIAMLGAMYGSTTGESGRLMPSLTRAYPKAIALVEAAARTGERGGRVETRLGRTSPLPGADWAQVQSAASAPDAGEREQARARSQARSWGRFTRNFVVQGTAAEWALFWMAGLRMRLAAIAAASPRERRPEIVFFLHDELLVHCTEGQAEAVEAAVREAADEAGRLLFGSRPVRFPLTVATVTSYAEAK